MNNHLGVRVCGEYACFSRPEFKVERVSYPIITPGAARGMLEAIFWKPEFHWQVRSIWVLKKIQQTSFLRNEIEDRQSKQPIVVEDKRQQRASLVLKDVEYVIWADVVLKPHANADPAKYRDQFRRRVERGQCHHTPYLGTREFTATFHPIRGQEVPQPIDMNFGMMLFDIAFFQDTSEIELQFRQHGAKGSQVVKGCTKALFFQAELRNGVMNVPANLYRKLYQREDSYVE
jgi:CRISPR-associated protein Cas5d